MAKFSQKVMGKEIHPEYIFMKLPANYNFSRFSKFETKKFKIRGFYLVCLFAG